MNNHVPKAIFLAGSTVEVISALACLAGLEIRDAVVFVERNISFKTAALDPLLAAARARFSTVQFIELEIERLPTAGPGARGWTSFMKRWQAAIFIRRQLDVVCQRYFGMDLGAVTSRMGEVYFNGLHDYVMVFLAASRKKPRFIFPHGFDQPSRLIIRREPFLHRRRSVLNALGTFGRQLKWFGPGGVALGFVGCVVPGLTTVCLPFTGVDGVLTFRSGTDPVANDVVRIQALKDIFQWLMEVPPWGELLRERKPNSGTESLLLLLSEYNRHPTWEQNRNYGVAHLRLLRAVSRVTGRTRFVIKAHVRSDGSAATWLRSFLREAEKGWQIDILPLALSGLPVEALALTGEFTAACSLGSCSLPPGLGFGMPHYVSLATAALFDEGWQGLPHSIKYAHVSRMLVDEGICSDLDTELPQSDLHAVTPPAGHKPPA